MPYVVNGKFGTLVACQKGIDKQCRPRSDCFWRSSLIMVFPVWFSNKHFVNSSPDTQHFIWEPKAKSIDNFRTFTVIICRSTAKHFFVFSYFRLESSPCRYCLESMMLQVCFLNQSVIFFQPLSFWACIQYTLVFIVLMQISWQYVKLKKNVKSCNWACWKLINKYICDVLFPSFII